MLVIMLARGFSFQKFDRDPHCHFRLDRLCLKKISVNTMSKLAFDVYNDDGLKNNIHSCFVFLVKVEKIFLLWIYVRNEAKACF